MSKLKSIIPKKRKLPKKYNIVWTKNLKNIEIISSKKSKLPQKYSILLTIYEKQIKL